MYVIEMATLLKLPLDTSFGQYSRLASLRRILTEWKIKWILQSILGSIE